MQWAVALFTMPLRHRDRCIGNGKLLLQETNELSGVAIYFHSLLELHNSEAILTKGEPIKNQRHSVKP